MSKKVFFISLLLLFVVGCKGEGGEEVGPGQQLQVFVFPGSQEKRLISQEVINLPNCTGNAESSQAVTRAHTVLYTLELGRQIAVSADGRAGIPGIGEVGVGTEVAASYRVGYGRSETVSRSQTVAAAPASHMQHTIQQFEIWETGELLIVAGEVNQRIPYSFRRDFSIEVVAPANIGCPGGGSIQTRPGNSEGTIPTPPSSSGSTGDSCIAKEQGPLSQTDHFFEGPVHVIQLWRQNGNTPWGTNELMAVVVGNVSIVAAGGNVWTYPSANCETVARVHMQDGANQRGSRILTEEQMREAGLIR
jgi:hypothetical protein